jgi:hypothetical protein
MTKTSRKRATQNVKHYSIRAGRAACGANQGVKFRAFVLLTTAHEEITCKACQKIAAAQQPSQSASSRN